MAASTIGLYLATKALEINGSDTFQVSANLTTSSPESLQAFDLFQAMLLMAYCEGQRSEMDTPMPLCSGYRTTDENEHIKRDSQGTPSHHLR